jgi:sugar O-acyltransferase (sialic acid O-acetyltransferase NeuD family)
MGDRVLVWGAGGHGRVVTDLVRAAGHRVRGYIDRNVSLLGNGMVADPACIMITESEWLNEMSHRRQARGFDALALGIGSNDVRQACFQKCTHVAMPPLVQPAAWVSPSAALGSGTVVLATAVVNAGAHLGCAVIVNSGAIVEHECFVGDAAHVSPGAVLCGGVRVGNRAWIGAGAVVIPNIRIGEGATVGAGAVVVRDVPDGVTVVGNPARALRATVEAAS